MLYVDKFILASGGSSRTFTTGCILSAKWGAICEIKVRMRDTEKKKLHVRYMRTFNVKEKGKAWIVFSQGEWLTVHL